jgi:ABC-type antimicrobial peptide transport system permease subunit
MGLPLLAGRDFTWEDRADSPPVAIINEAFAHEYFPETNPLGQTLVNCNGSPEARIVGVVANTKASARSDTNPAAYIPFLQPPSMIGTTITFTMRTSGNPVEMAPAVRGIMETMHPDVAIFDLESGVVRNDRQLADERRITALLAVFGGLALLLASIGLYGLLSNIVNRRTSEIGIRMALGAYSGDIIGMIFRESLIPVVAGTIVGTIASFALARWIETMLFGVSRVDPIALAGASIVLLITATLAAFVPVRRALRIDPLQAIRYE